MNKEERLEAELKVSHELASFIDTVMKKFPKVLSKDDFQKHINSIVDIFDVIDLNMICPVCGEPLKEHRVIDNDPILGKVFRCPRDSQEQEEINDPKTE